MSDIISKYLAEKIIEDLRNGRELPDEFFDELFMSPVKPELRALIEENDLELIKKLVRSDYKNKIVMGFVLARKLLQLPEYRQFLEEQWLISQNPDVKIAILYDIAEYDFENKFTKDFIEYLKIEIENYRRHLEEWYEGNDDLLIASVLKYLARPALKHMKWLYIINASVSSNPEKAIEIISGYLNDEDMIVSETAIYFVNKLNSK